MEGLVCFLKWDSIYIFTEILQAENQKSLSDSLYVNLDSQCWFGIWNRLSYNSV